jgi:hypothetical protein
MARNIEATPRHVERLLEVALHYMGQDLRQRLMVEAPDAYNAYHGRTIVGPH